MNTNVWYVVDTIVGSSNSLKKIIHIFRACTQHFVRYKHAQGTCYVQEIFTRYTYTCIIKYTAYVRFFSNIQRLRYTRKLERLTVFDACKFFTTIFSLSSTHSLVSLALSLSLSRSLARSLALFSIELFLYTYRFIYVYI